MPISGHFWKFSQWMLLQQQQQWWARLTSNFGEVLLAEIHHHHHHYCCKRALFFFTTITTITTITSTTTTCISCPSLPIWPPSLGLWRRQLKIFLRSSSRCCCLCCSNSNRSTFQSVQPEKKTSATERAASTVLSRSLSSGQLFFRLFLSFFLSSLRCHKVAR